MYHHSDSDDEYYKWKEFKEKIAKRDEPVIDFFKFIVDKYDIDVIQDFDMYVEEKDNKIKEQQNECTHSNVMIIDCPEVRGDYIHKTHGTNCKSCNNLMCVECKKMFICENCYNDTKEKDNYYYYDSKYSGVVLEKFEYKYCDKCKRNYDLPIWYIS